VAGSALDDEGTSRQIAFMTLFVHLLWQSDAEIMHQITGVSFVRRALKFCGGHTNLEEHVSFQVTVISAASTLSHVLSDTGRKSLRRVILRLAQGPQDLSVACKSTIGIICTGRISLMQHPAAISLYVLNNEDCECPTTLLAAWDYLRTALSTILAGDHILGERALALIVSPAVCHALLKLVVCSAIVGSCPLRD